MISGGQHPVLQQHCTLLMFPRLYIRTLKLTQKSFPSSFSFPGEVWLKFFPPAHQTTKQDLLCFSLPYDRCHSFIILDTDGNILSCAFHNGPQLSPWQKMRTYTMNTGIITWSILYNQVNFNQGNIRNNWGIKRLVKIVCKRRKLSMT